MFGSGLVWVWLGVEWKVGLGHHRRQDPGTRVPEDQGTISSLSYQGLDGLHSSIPINKLGHGGRMPPLQESGSHETWCHVMAIASTGLLKPHRYPRLPASSAWSCFTMTSSSPQICCALRPTNGPLMAFGRRQCNQCNHGPGRRAPFPQKLPCHACHATGRKRHLAAGQEASATATAGAISQPSWCCIPRCVEDLQVLTWRWKWALWDDF